MIEPEYDLIRDRKCLEDGVQSIIPAGSVGTGILEQKGHLVSSSYGIKDTRGLSYIKNEFVDVGIKNGEVVMQTPLPPWGVVVIEGPSVGAARSAFFKARSHGVALFRIPLDTFEPRGTPESRARFGVQIMQIASLFKNSSIVSLRPEYYGGKVKESYLSESYRIGYLEKIASQGFAWIEIEQTIENDKIREIVKKGRASGSKIMLTCRLDDMKEWGPPDDIDKDLFDGYKIIVPVKDGKGLRRMIRSSINARKWLKNKTLIMEPMEDVDKLPWVINALSLSDLIDIKLDEIITPGEDMIRDRVSIWKSLGITGVGMSKDWSLRDRELTPETMVFLQVGKTKGKTYRSWIFNAQFNKLKLDGMMIPWECDSFSIDRTLQMAKRMDIRGIMVEMPLRSNIVKMMDWVDPRSASVGSIDVVSIRNGKANGYNSEIYGIADQILSMNIKKEIRVVVLGTGASGRSAAVATSMMGMNTYLAGNSRERAQLITNELSKEIKPTSFKALQKPGSHFDIIINSVPFEARTVKGLTNQTMEIAEMVKEMNPEYGLDLYNKMPWTPFLAAIESTGARAVSGSDVLVRTSLRAFKLLTGDHGSRDCIADVVEEVHSQKID